VAKPQALFEESAKPLMDKLVSLVNQSAFEFIRGGLYFRAKIGESKFLLQITVLRGNEVGGIFVLAPEEQVNNPVAFGTIALELTEEAPKERSTQPFIIKGFSNIAVVEKYEQEISAELDELEQNI